MLKMMHHKLISQQFSEIEKLSKRSSSEIQDFLLLLLQPEPNSEEDKALKDLFAALITIIDSGAKQLESAKDNQIKTGAVDNLVLTVFKKKIESFSETSSNASRYITSIFSYKTSSGETLLHKAMDGRLVGLVNFIIQFIQAEVFYEEDRNKVSALMKLVKFGLFEEEKSIRFLMSPELRLDITRPSSEGATCLGMAVACGSLSSVTNLIRYGNFSKQQLSDALFQAGWWAEKYVNLDVLDTLHKEGADFNARNNTTNTPLHYAVIQKEEISAFYDVVTKIVLLGADPDSKDSLGTTPAHCAIVVGNTRMVSFLIKKGIDLDHKDIWGNDYMYYIHHLCPLRKRGKLIRLFTEAMTTKAEMKKKQESSDTDEVKDQTTPVRKTQEKGTKKTLHRKKPSPEEKKEEATTPVSGKPLVNSLPESDTFLSMPDTSSPILKAKEETVTNPAIEENRHQKKTETAHIIPPPPENQRPAVATPSESQVNQPDINSGPEKTTINQDLKESTSDSHNKPDGSSVNDPLNNDLPEKPGDVKPAAPVKKPVSYPLRNISFDEIIDFLKTKGFSLLESKRGHGSHTMMRNHQSISVTIPHHNPIAIGTLRSILESAGIEKVEFSQYMLYGGKTTSLN